MTSAMPAMRRAVGISPKKMPTIAATTGSTVAMTEALPGSTLLSPSVYSRYGRMQQSTDMPSAPNIPFALVSPDQSAPNRNGTQASDANMKLQTVIVFEP